MEWQRTEKGEAPVFWGKVEKKGNWLVESFDD